MEPQLALTRICLLPQQSATLYLAASARERVIAVAMKTARPAYPHFPARWRCNPARPRRSHLLWYVPAATCAWDLAVPHRAARSYMPAPAARCARKPEQQLPRRHREDIRQPANPAPPAPSPQDYSREQSRQTTLCAGDENTCRWHQSFVPCRFCLPSCSHPELPSARFPVAPRLPSCVSSAPP